MQAARRPRPTRRSPAQPSYGFAFRAMSSACELRLEGDDEATLAALAQRAIDEVLRIEHKYSRYRDDSIVSRINAAAGGADAVTVDAETAALLAFAGDLHSASEGLFDITSGVLRRAWDFRAGRLPEPAALAALLPLIGWGRVELGNASVQGLLVDEDVEVAALHRHSPAFSDRPRGRPLTARPAPRGQRRPLTRRRC